MSSVTCDHFLNLFNSCLIMYVLCYHICGEIKLCVCVTLPAGRPAGRRARGRSGGRHSTAGQCGYVPLGDILYYFAQQPDEQCIALTDRNHRAVSAARSLTRQAAGRPARRQSYRRRQTINERHTKAVASGGTIHQDAPGHSWINLEEFILCL